MVFGPAAAWRPLIIPATTAAAYSEANEAGSNRVSSVRASTIPAVATEPALDTPRKRNYSWAELMKRVFLVDVLECERCAGGMKIIAAIHSPNVAVKILKCLDLPTRAPPQAPAVSDHIAHA